MPEISRFFGIIIRIYNREHGVPHFHAIYGADEAVIAIETLACIDGRLPRRAQLMVLESESTRDSDPGHRFRMQSKELDEIASQATSRSSRRGFGAATLECAGSGGSG